ncbi:MAG: TetR/AcrR family transcriptional regulator [candidate division Zixibacteria bacterium]|nr:TetR/AcrR family transcriptional regulator [candidate division Zixibacteria bacterium]MDH3937530.1 TetR/AcrR family transcriptional regulator [candidate division Zixibacteria bacterium]MDH4035422.1 TetR/AcrR family transcriptional regulator [candidate division Zixibacteria bacterium]
MTPKIQFAKPDVVQAAFEVLKDRGLSGLTARNVAGQLGSSTAPVYAHFDNMKELEVAAVRKARDLLIDYTSRPHTDRVFLSMGVGIAKFARDHARLYRAIFLERKEFRIVVDEFLQALTSEFAKDPRFEAMADEDSKYMLTKMWVFTHGLASLLCVGLVDDESDEHIVSILDSVGTVVIKATIADCR